MAFAVLLMAKRDQRLWWTCDDLCSRWPSLTMDQRQIKDDRLGRDCSTWGSQGGIRIVTRKGKP
ncbi:transcription regulator [Sesbania bispinosa]|nr:transcription regulator [Sesbania bispinosa]